MFTIWVMIALFQGQMERDFLQKLIPFDTVYEGFKIELLGCPERFKTERLVDTTQCNPTLGTINAHDWVKIRKEAMKVFELQEKK